jgi:hypothetical protein
MMDLESHSVDDGLWNMLRKHGLVLRNGETLKIIRRFRGDLESSLRNRSTSSALSSSTASLEPPTRPNNYAPQSSYPLDQYWCSLTGLANVTTEGFTEQDMYNADDIDEEDMNGESDEVMQEMLAHDDHTIREQKRTSTIQCSRRRQLRY